MNSAYRRSLALALTSWLFAILPSGPQSSPLAQTPIKPAITAVCSPGSVQITGKPAVQTKNPIAFALTQAGPGSQIRLEKGSYPRIGIGFSGNQAWNARTSGGTPGRPIRVFSNGGATITHGGGGDTIAVSNQLSPGHITFENIQIVPGYRAGVIFYGGSPNIKYEGFRFLDCDILGKWNHMSNSGEKSTWGVWAFGLADFEFRGVRRRARIENLRKEHAFYLQNPQGDVTIENVDGKFLGRTFCQFTARSSDGPPGRGTLTVKNCHVDEVCLAATDNFKGGSAMTFAGRLEGPIVLEGNQVRIGFTAGVKKLTMAGIPYGTGALMVWDTGGEANGSLTLRGNKFSSAPGCGDRPLVSIGGVLDVRIEGRNEFSSDGPNPTLVIDPVGAGGRTTNTPTERVYLAADTKLVGPVLMLGEPLSDKQRTKLEQPFADRPREEQTGDKPAQRRPERRDG